MIAATNRPDILDPALLRPGRFDDKFKLDVRMLKVVKQFFTYTLETNHLMKQLT